MPDARDETLREAARHRGFRLVKSRRRKPGGDFGKYGLNDASGAPVFGMDDAGLTASADAIEDYLRGAASTAWGKSAGSAKARAKPKAESAPKPKPKPKPRFKVRVDNLLARLPAAAKRAEAFTELVARPGVRVERIVSRGQATPEDQPMVQDQNEWVLLLEGAAGLRSRIRTRSGSVRATMSGSRADKGIG